MAIRSRVSARPPAARRNGVGASAMPGMSKALLGVAILGVLLVVAGAALSLAPTRDAGRLPGQTSRPSSGSSSPGPAPSPAPAAVSPDSPSQGLEDAIAARPMASLPLSSATPGPVSTRDPGPVIVVPECPQAGPAGVPTGCPRSPAGALAQLIAIDRTALQSGTMAGAREVITAWAVPGGPTTTSWSGVHAMASLLSPKRGRSASGLSAVPVVLTPVMGLFKGQYKGQSGDDFVVPCVGFELAVTLTQTARVGVSDCQRMTWIEGVVGATGRWMIGAGPEPVQAPNVWPDTDAAIDAGFTDLAWQP